MTQALAGRVAILKASTATGQSATKIAELREASISGAMSEIDATSHDSSGIRELISGTRSFTGSANHLYVDDDATQEIVYTLLEGGTKTDWEYMPVGSSSGTHWAGSGFITRWENSSPNEDAIAVDLEFSFSGTLTLTTST